MDYRQLMNGAGLGDVLIPKSEFVKEHERLVALLNQSDIPALRKEAKAQKAELAEKGGSRSSNFIARMMAEAKYKHRSPDEKDLDYSPKLGKYVRGSVMDPDKDETKMKRADKFNYNALATKNQTSSSTKKKGNPYGASPFISYHFGNAQSKPRESAIQKAQRNRFRKKRVNVSRVKEEDEEDEEDEEEEEKSSQEKRMASIAAYKERKRNNPFPFRGVAILPESQKRKERRDKQSDAKRREEERKRSTMSESMYEHIKGLEREQRAKKKKEKDARKLPEDIKDDFRPKAFSDGRPTGMFVDKIEELLKPRRTFVRKGESSVRTPAEQRDVDRQLARLVKEMDDRGYDPNKLGIKGFNPDKYR
jgi:hypothetical protein